MEKYRGVSDAVHLYINEIQCSLVAKTGIPSDRYHFGKLTLEALRDAPETILQIDGVTEETESYNSVLERTVKCANAFRNLGLHRNDVIILMAPNHIHLSIPMYAAFYLGVSVAGIDMYLLVNELEDNFKDTEPKVVFCQNDRAEDVKKALSALNLTCKVVTFDKGPDYEGFDDFLNKHGHGPSPQEFRASDFDPVDTTLFLIATSGTTGLPKTAEVTHKNMMHGISYMWANFEEFPKPTRLPIIVSPIQWFSAIFFYATTPMFRLTRLQSSLTMTQELAYDLINKYKPTFAFSSPNMWTTLFKPGHEGKCDFSCFEVIFIGGSAMHPSLFEEMKKTIPDTFILNVYGQSELGGLGMIFDPYFPKSLGRPVPYLKARLVNPETEEEINVPNVSGELWLKGPSVFKGYRNRPDATRSTLTEDGWLLTGDIMYRDDKWYFYYVDRWKLLLKYRNHQISPVEIEGVIQKHPGVFEVAVTGIPHLEHGDLPVACVVLHEGFRVDAEEIKEMVKSSLTDSKQLRGGVLFMKELPMTPSMKVDRKKLARLVREKVNVE
ncbi:luciferin 4-monooxygenase-like isoform X1 [Leptidea sinapis]|uniref:luciferin 4-monooxygenase-like isoform X1 n=2 Tax=Leptidea sinapis TaxID=189913 RepID=UPI00211F559C|nr:luciferin 4-monooxygenase-like isoform X1 [Leptidea sinapis]XP_050679621.1 luciferin 4-monooxygenase-like isoform X1 [Leptidea sinapis]